MYLISISILVLILVIFYLEVYQKKETTPEPKPILTATVSAGSAENFANPSDITYDDVMKKKSLEDSVVDSHRQYVANTRQFSSGANFTSVADDNNSTLFTNFLGFVRPYKVDILPGARQIPDIDDSVFARNKHMYFKSDQLN
jgi:hypothetical protein